MTDRAAVKQSAFAAPAAEEDPWLPQTPLLEALAARERLNYVSTEVVVRGVSMPADLGRVRTMLEAQLHAATAASGPAAGAAADVNRDLHALNAEDVAALAARPPDDTPADVVAALRRVFDVTALPTHADLVALYPWLDPHAAPRRLAPAELEREMAEVVAADPAALITPAPWVHMFGNPFAGMCEVLTAEYVDGLARYLHNRLATTLADAFHTSPADGNGNGNVTVLEVGAGSGRLTHHLRQRVRALLPPALAARVRFVATDVRGNTAVAGRLPVGRASYQAALTRYRPAIVLASWMSKDEDWTPAFRAAASVREYILIGERDYGVSGTAAGTWGAAPAADGFVRLDLERLSLLQVCRTDTPAVRFHCKTAVFRRRHTPAKLEL